MGYKQVTNKRNPNVWVTNRLQTNVTQTLRHKQVTNERNPNSCVTNRLQTKRNWRWVKLEGVWNWRWVELEVSGIGGLVEVKVGGIGGEWNWRVGGIEGGWNWRVCGIGGWFWCMWLCWCVVCHIYLFIKKYFIYGVWTLAERWNVTWCKHAHVHVNVNILVYNSV